MVPFGVSCFFVVFGLLKALVIVCSCNLSALIIQEAMLLLDAALFQEAMVAPGLLSQKAMSFHAMSVSYTHLTLPTNREV